MVSLTDTSVKTVREVSSFSSPSVLETGQSSITSVYPPLNHYMKHHTDSVTAPNHAKVAMATHGEGSRRAELEREGEEATESSSSSSPKLETDMVSREMVSTTSEAVSYTVFARTRLWGKYSRYYIHPCRM